MQSDPTKRHIARTSGVVPIILSALAICTVVLGDLRASFHGIGVYRGYPRVSELLGVITIFWAVFEVFRRGQLSSLDRQQLLVLLFLLSSFFFGHSLFRSGQLSGSEGVFRSGILIPCLFYIGVSNLRISETHLFSIFKFIFIVFSLNSCAIIMQGTEGFIDESGLFQLIEETRGKRYYGMAYQASRAGFFATIGFVLGVLLFVSSKKFIWRTFIFSAVLLNAITILLVAARTAIVASVCVLLFISLKNFFSDFKKSFLLTILICLSGIILYTVIESASSSTWQFSERIYDYSLESRLRAWSEATDIALHRIIGTGIGGYGDPSRNGGVITIAHAQNAYLFLAATLGIHTMMLFLVILFFFFKSIKKPQLYNAKGNSRLSLITGSVFGIWLIFSLTEITLASYDFSMLLFGFAGLYHAYLKYQAQLYKVG